MNVEVMVSDQQRSPEGFAAVAIEVRDLGAVELLDFALGAGHPPLWQAAGAALDLLLTAAVAYVLDKAVPRRLANDRWTRAFSVRIPVADPATWRGVGDRLGGCLSFLTGDEWEMTFVERTVPLFENPPPPTLWRDVRAVSLFSGGLDSLIGAIDHLSGHPERLALVGHHDATGPAGDQRRMAQQLDTSPTFHDRMVRSSVRLRPLPPNTARASQRVISVGREHTLRSRSLVFLALGLCAARTLGDEAVLLVPENGFIAINIPLTLSRIGSCSTRTTHPYFVSELRHIAADLGLGTPIVNPLESKTKGEAIAACTDQAMIAQLARETVSCAHASRRTHWVRRSARNCGYCVPCLIRRAALHHVGWDEGMDYGIDVCNGEIDLNADKAADLRAVLECVGTVRTSDAIAARVAMTGPLPLQHRDTYREMVGRGLDEVRSFIRAKGDAAIKRRAGVR